VPTDVVSLEQHGDIQHSDLVLSVPKPRSSLGGAPLKQRAGGAAAAALPQGLAESLSYWQQPRAAPSSGPAARKAARTSTSRSRPAPPRSAPLVERRSGSNLPKGQQQKRAKRTHGDSREAHGEAAVRKRRVIVVDDDDFE